MTKAEILKQTEELKKQVEELSDDEKKIRTLPIEDEKYIYINSINLGHYENSYLAEEDSSLGNYFKSKDDAEMAIRAMQIEQSIRIRRIELNDGWEPDWDDLAKEKYHIIFNHIMGVDKYVNDTYSYDYFPIFGYYKSKEIAQQIIDEFKSDLEWYFNEYYPNRDNIYVWGQNND